MPLRFSAAAESRLEAPIGTPHAVPSTLQSQLCWSVVLVRVVIEKEAEEEEDGRFFSSSVMKD
jgi:hypothetical protein